MTTKDRHKWQRRERKRKSQITHFPQDGKTSQEAIRNAILKRRYRRWKHIRKEQGDEDG